MSEEVKEEIEEQVEELEQTKEADQEKEQLQAEAEVTTTLTEEVLAEENVCEIKPQIDKKKKAIEYVKRYLVLCIGLFIMAFGVSFSIKADLGTSPVSSIPYTLNLATEASSKIPTISVGVTTIIVNVLIVVLQIILLRRKFKPIQLIQIPISIIFGLLINLTNDILRGITLSAYWQQWLICIVGIVLVAIGVSFEVTAKACTLPGEGLTLALCSLLPKVKFGLMKIIVDCTMVILAVIISFAFIHKLRGVREGTVAAAVCVGFIARLFNKFMIPLGNKFFGVKKAE
ncbi:MAG: YitT family protein [Clostridia bacterium]|nr:YitT family protein [Clostridia bacterium]